MADVIESVPGTEYLVDGKRKESRKWGFDF
jgi:hypothetical protein